jgi:hypothetical protein
VEGPNVTKKEKNEKKIEKIKRLIDNGKTTEALEMKEH